MADAIVLAAIAVSSLIGLAVGFSVGRRRSMVAANQQARKDRSASESELGQSDELRARHIERAFDDLRLGTIIYDSEERELYRNRYAQQFATGRHGDALVAAAVDRVRSEGIAGRLPEERLELFGPPPRTLLVQASPLRYVGGVPGVLVVVEDVTETQHLDTVRSDFVANVSHELRTPVGAMSVLAETLVDAEDPAVIDRLANRIQGESIRLAETIDDLLILSRLEAGAQRELGTVDLNSVVTMAVDRVAQVAARKSISIGIERETFGPLLVEGDQADLVSAVANLLENAVKYSDEQGSVRVVLAMSTQAEADLATVTVIDDGIGIPERDLDRVFERFYRVDSARSRETGGTGLGLSIVRHVMRNHNGSVELTSSEGNGSRFTLRLPVSVSQPG